MAIQFLQGSENPSQDPRRTLVFLATHDGEGKSLPHMYRSFISFSFGDKLIEEFGLIAVVSGDRMEKEGYASFTDNTTTYDNLDGLQYWSTHFQTNTFHFTLATDEMTENLLLEFLHWFRPGDTKELILAEHPNRAILARVSAVPQLHLLPFEGKTTVKISGKEYETSTTLYRGEIDLELVADTPHWYGKTNILGRIDTSTSVAKYVDEWKDVKTGLWISVFASKDALKVLLEDGIPLGSMFSSNMLLGNRSFAKVESGDNQNIWSIEEKDIIWINGVPSNGVGATIARNDLDTEHGVIAGAIVNVDGNGISELANNLTGYFFYAGTAPSPTKISFSFTPTFSDNYYIETPANTYNKTTSDRAYNTLTITSRNEQELRFTTPNVFTSYNKAIEIFDMLYDSKTDTWDATLTWNDVLETIRADVHHPAARAWAAHVVRDAAAGGDTSKSITERNTKENNQELKGINDIKLHMKWFLLNTTDNTTVTTIKVEFNSENGEAIGTYHYRTLIDDLNAYFNKHEEDIGDMLRSNYIVIRDRNYPSDEGRILPWENTDKGHTYSHKIEHDMSVPINNLIIEYKNMYL